MRASRQNARHNDLWEDSNDILRGINGTRAMPASSHRVDASAGLPPPEICLDSSAPLMGFQFGSGFAVPPHNAASILGPLFSNYDSASSPQAPTLDLSNYSVPRFSTDQDVWTPLKVTGVPTINGPLMCPPRGPSHQGYGLDRRFSTGPYSTPSETDSQYASLHPSESGYSTQSCTTRSVAASYAIDSACSPYSAPFESEQDERLSMLDLNATSYGDPIDMLERMQSPSLMGPDAIKCDFSDCQWTGKCPSDKRKHDARHRKLFKCDEPNCTRKDGFGTINDLARHKKCVHKQEPERGPKVLYMCFGIKCPRKNKKWPRLDNFRQHLARMHSDEDAEDLLKQSHEWYEDCVKPQMIALPSVNRLSETSSPQMQEITDEADSRAEDFPMAPSCAYARARMEVDGMAPGSARDEQRCSSLNYTIPESAQPTPRSVEGPAVNNFNANGSLDPKVTSAAPLESPRSEKMDEMVADAAMNLINAMTKSMNISQRRQSHRSDDTEDTSDYDVGLTEPRREILQKILKAALVLLDKGSESSLPRPQLPKEVSSAHPNQKKWIQCEFCTKKTRLRCEMKKHQKRHERPYSCTFPQCNKTFGSKADWKRHENSQHLHSESWGCTLPDATQEGLPCARLFYRQETYIQHLKKQHEIDEEDEIRAALSDNHVCQDGRASFWCGFCRDDVPLSQGLVAWTERFNHIDTEHYKKGERIEDWVFPSDQPKSRSEQREGNETISIDAGREVEPAVDEHSDEECAHSDVHPESENLWLHDDHMMLDDAEPVRKRPTKQSRETVQSTLSQPQLSNRSRAIKKRKYSVLHPALNSGSA